MKRPGEFHFEYNAVSHLYKKMKKVLKLLSSMPNSYMSQEQAVRIGGDMSSTYKNILVIAAFLAAPVQTWAFDFDKEIAKQNNVSVEVLSNKEQRSLDKGTSSEKGLKVTLIARK